MAEAIVLIVCCQKKQGRDKDGMICVARDVPSRYPGVQGLRLPQEEGRRP